MSDASAFLRKRKDRRRPPAARTAAESSTPADGPSPSSASPAASSLPTFKGPINLGVKEELARSDEEYTRLKASGQIVEIKLVSSGVGLGADVRYNLMKLNSVRDFDPTTIPPPILLNRKQPGPRAPPTFALDDEGNILGRYVYDEKGHPVMGSDGKQVIDVKEKADTSLIGGEAGKRKARKGVKDVFHQDKEVMRLRREEAVPWVLESGRAVGEANGDGSADAHGSNGAPEHWVGRLVEAAAMPTVLLVNDGAGDGFRVWPLGRTYRFEPERPFKVLDPDAAHKLYEHQTKHKIHDRWAQREAGPSTGLVADGIAVPNQGDIKPKIEGEGEAHLRQEVRAARLEARMRAARTAAAGIAPRPKVKVERFDDDERREGRKLTRGMEGGVDEELDYDFNEEFQDDEENNTFYRDADEEEEAKLQEERQKKEYRLANANVGDKPQIEDEMSDEEGLFGGGALTADGKKLRRMMRKRLGSEDLFGDTDDESDTSESTAHSEKPKESGQNETERSAPPAAERPSRPPSRGPNNRGISSPTGRPRPPSTTGKASTAPPGSGHSLAAQRATSRAASPRGSRGNSPLARGTSPDGGASPGPSGHEGSPAPGPGRGMSPSLRADSPAIVGRDGSTVGGGAPSPAGSTARPKNLKRTDSPTPGPGSPARPTLGTPSGKRKSSPNPSGAVAGGGPSNPPRKKKKSSNTPTPGPEDIPPFPGIITKEEILAWFRRQPPLVPMGNAIAAFRQRIIDGGERQADNQRLFLVWVGRLTTTEEGKKLRLKEEYR